MNCDRKWGENGLMGYVYKCLNNNLFLFFCLNDDVDNNNTMILLEQHVFLLLLLNKYVCYYRFVVWRSQASHKVRDVSFLQYMKTTMNANLASPQSWPHLKLCNHIPGKNLIRNYVKRLIALCNNYFCPLRIIQ